MKSENKPNVFFELKDFQTSISCEVIGSDPHILTIKENHSEQISLTLPKDLIENFFAGKASSLEIEAKYLLSELPTPLNPPKEIEQAYPIITQDGSELRVRKKGADKFYLSIKQGTGAVRSEFTLKISQEDYKRLKDISRPRVIQKKRFLLDLAHSPRLTLEIDEYLNHSEGIDLRGLLIAEIEFPSQKELEKFSISKLAELGVCVAKEVTHEPKFSNKELALSGLRNLL